MKQKTKILMLYLGTLFIIRGLFPSGILSFEKALENHVENQSFL